MRSIKSIISSKWIEATIPANDHANDDDDDI